MGTDSVIPTPSEPTLASSGPPACVDQFDLAVLQPLAEHLMTSLGEVGAALDSYDIATAMSGIRIVAADSRALADAFEPNSPVTASHWLRVAEAMDQAASSLSDDIYDDALSWIVQSTREMELAMDGLTNLFGDNPTDCN